MPGNEVKEGQVYRPRCIAWTGCVDQVSITLHPSQRWKVVRIYDWGYGLQNHFVTIYFKREKFDMYFVEAKKHEHKHK